MPIMKKKPSTLLHHIPFLFISPPPETSIKSMFQYHSPSPLPASYGLIHTGPVLQPHSELDGAADVARGKSSGEAVDAEAHAHVVVAAHGVEVRRARGRRGGGGGGRGGGGHV